MKKILFILSGDDLSIIRQCNKKIQNRFAWIGGLVACIMVVSFFSFSTAFTNLFNQPLIGVVLGLFFALMIANIYLLILYTLSKNLLPYNSSKGAKWVSISLRVFLIGVFAVIVAKPFELIILKSILENDIKEYKIKEYTRGEKTIASLYEQSLQELKWLEQHGDATVASTIEQMQVDKGKDLRELRNRIIRSDFYIQQLRLLNSQHLVTWLFTIFMIALFLAPIYIKYLLPEQADFYQMKKDIEMRIVLDEYATFKRAYRDFWQNYFISFTETPIDSKARINLVMSEILRKKYEFEVNYVDPPFNTLRKKDSRDFSEQEALIKDLYDV